MALTTEVKLKNLVIEIQNLCKMYNEITMKAAKKTQIMFSVQIILTTATTILLGLKLGENGQSVAFVLSAIATGLSSWYNIEIHRKSQIQFCTHSFELANLASQVLFYTINFDPLEESKFLEYSKTYFELCKDFQELTSLSLNPKDMKKEAEAK